MLFLPGVLIANEFQVISLEAANFDPHLRLLPLSSPSLSFLSIVFRSFVVSGEAVLDLPYIGDILPPPSELPGAFLLAIISLLN